MDLLAVPAGLTGTLAVAAFVVALIGIVSAPLLHRSRRFTGPSAILGLLPFAVLLVAAVLAALSTGLGAVTRQGLGIREIATAALAIICLTPVLGATAVRLRYGSTGSRTFHQQIAANRVSSVLLVAVLVEVLAVTGFLVGAAVGLFLDLPVLTGLVFAGLSLVATAVATLVALKRGDQLILDLAKARLTDGSPKEQQLDNVVAELAVAAGLERPRVFIIETDAPNAFAVGSDARHASIAVTRGLLNQLDREELQGVVAHELAHVRNLDSRHGLLVALLVGAVVVLTGVFFEAVVEIATHPSIGGDSLSEVIAGLVVWLLVSLLAILFAGTLKLVAPLAARAVQAAVSRDREYLADATSVEITRNPAGLISALHKLEGAKGRMPEVNSGMQHLWFVNPLREGRDGGRGWFDTHPSTRDRMARLRELQGLGTTDGSPEAQAAPREDATTPEPA